MVLVENTTRRLEEARRSPTEHRRFSLSPGTLSITLRDVASRHDGACLWRPLEKSAASLPATGSSWCRSALTSWRWWCTS